MECNFKIERDPHVKGYTMISNASNGKVLSLAAKGLLKELLSLPSDWYLSVDGLVRNLKESKRVVVSVLKELEDNSYLIKEKRFRQSSTCKRRVYTYFYTIIENPSNEQLQNEGVQNEYLQNEYVQNEDVQNEGVQNRGDIIINNKEINKDNKDLDNNNKESNDSSIATAKRKASIDYEEFKEFFNMTMDEAGAMIPRADRITPKRKGMINARVREYGMEKVREVVRKSAASTYMNGGGWKGWVATFDWIFSPNNFIKIFENNYNDNKPNNNGRTNNGLAGETPQTNADRAAEWATNRIKEVLENAKRKNQGGVQGEIPDGGSRNGGLLPF